MQVVVNGDQRSFREGITLAELVDEVGANHSGVAVALDGAVIGRTRWQHTAVPDGAAIEILTAVQGG
jgi:sulfur carrier protein